MIYPAADKLDTMESKYALVIVAAKRARQLKDGARKVTDTRSTNPLTVALEEIADQAIIPVQVGEPEQLPTSVAPTAVLTGLVSTSIGEEEPMHEPTAAEIGALLTDSEEVAALEPDAKLDEHVIQSDSDVVEAETEDAAQEGVYEIPTPGDEDLGIVAEDTVQHAEDEMMEEAETEAEEE